jgi:hypothetical protein
MTPNLHYSTASNGEKHKDLREVNEEGEDASTNIPLLVGAPLRLVARTPLT